MWEWLSRGLGCRQRNLLDSQLILFLKRHQLRIAFLCFRRDAIKIEIFRLDFSVTLNRRLALTYMAGECRMVGRLLQSLIGRFQTRQIPGLRLSL